MSHNDTRLAVVGTWHQASVVSACFADMGYRVIGIGDDVAAVAALNSGRAPVFEPGLDEILKRNIELDRLHFTTRYDEGLRGVDFVFICIDTPVGPDDESDLRPILAAADSVATGASGPFLLCIGSQVPIGACHRLGHTVASLQPRYAIPVVYVPEFLRLGNAVSTFREADRFVIGADDEAVAARVAALYEPLGRPIYKTDVQSAEMGKHASNAFLAMSISFINQIASLCEQTNADVTEVAAIMRLDRRIGPHAFLSAGLGYAGGTLGREIRALRRLGQAYDVDTSLLEAIERVNADRVPAILRWLERVYPSLTGRRIAVLGLTYKPGTSTLRRSAALELIDRLLAKGATVTAFDPLARLEELREPPPFVWCEDPVAALRGADAAVLVAPWSGIDDEVFAAGAPAMRRAILLDTGNFLSPSKLVAAGYTYVGVGRGTTVEQS